MGGSVDQMKLPEGNTGSAVQVILLRAQIGTPYISQPPSFLFGSVIEPPETDESGNPLAPGENHSYWLPEPYAGTGGDHAGAGYYWSPHARQVFATQAGPIFITWKKALGGGAPVTDEMSAIDPGDDTDSVHVLASPPSAGTLTGEVYDGAVLVASFSVDSAGMFAFTLDGSPADFPTGGDLDIGAQTITLTWNSAPGPNHVVSSYDAYINNLGAAQSPAIPDYEGTDSAAKRALYTVAYNVSNGVVAGKKARRMYWTEGRYRTLGKVVPIPTEQISGGVHIVFNSDFPEAVPADDIVDPTTDPFFVGPNKQSTLFLDDGSLHAYNREGRVFVELLGDSTGGQTRQHLGFEILDVLREPLPVGRDIELGERILPAPGGSIEDLRADPILRNALQDFAYQHNTPDGRAEFYAIRITRNLNDYMVHWLEEGQQGILWPTDLMRYRLHWPVDPSRYDHYIRPAAASAVEAEETAIPLPAEKVPFLQFQDVFPQTPYGAKLTPELEFYTWLGVEHPVHRTLLRFSSGENIAFHRVLSWLDTGLKANASMNLIAAGDGLDNSVAEELSGWSETDRRLPFLDPISTPRVVGSAVDVGQRIEAPVDEVGGMPLAGRINLSEGTSYNVNAYKDPLVAGFEEANQGAIIPVNAIPGRNQLEVWWFRPTGGDVGYNAGNGVAGFPAVLWPSVVARYNIAWPDDADEIVLASNDGSGSLDSLKATGSIYYQNEPSLPGYNPNEEHALLLGGQVFALRDDLNVHQATIPAVIEAPGVTYSSEPFVLLEYVEADGRPAITPFKALREKPSEGITFNYQAEAGLLLQPPMPLPFLPKPVPDGSNVSLNREVGVYEIMASSYNAAATNSSFQTVQPHALAPFRKYVVQNPADLSKYHWFFVTSTDPSLKNADGIVSSQDAIRITWRSGLTFGMSRSAGLQSGDTVALFNMAMREWSWVSLETVVDTNITLAAGAPSFAPNAELLVIAKTDLTIDQFAGWTLSPEITPEIDVAYRQAYRKFTLEDRKNQTWVYRGPHAGNLSESVFEMQYYYKTLPGFHYPNELVQPAVGIITPYLRIQNADGSYQGNATLADLDSNQAFPIAYTPRWPANVPEMDTAETLLLPKRGLPAIRGQSSLNVIYQQSRSKVEGASDTVVLHDPTRDKEYFLIEGELSRVPVAASTESYGGLTYFKQLPPHLAQRFFFDPNRGDLGALVLKGEFVPSLLGEPYVLINALGADDLAQLKNVVVGGEDKNNWDNAIDGLSATIQRFHEAPPQSGIYVPIPGADRKVLGGDISEVTDSNEAVDSFALSATGPGTGYVTLIAGNGGAFTAPDDPVSLHIIKVRPDVHRGDLNIVSPGDPLSERLTLQQGNDLAGQVGDYRFEWRYAPPADGEPPAFDADADNPGAAWLAMASGEFPDGVRANWGGGGSVKTLSDNYVIMRMGIKDVLDEDNDMDTDEILRWSQWTDPNSGLVEGWIKRVLAGINPFRQRTDDLFNNRVNTDVSLIAQAGKRWEGDVALNSDTINDFGLIEIYETVLKRGRGLSIDAGINFGPANDALLLAAGYLNDLYMLVGNEAWADAANPTIGIGTQDQSLGDIATALFSFKGQTPSLLEEELALLRGRDDFLVPGVEVAPVYNRLVWNYTRGIDSGEVIYALNYNIQENPDQTPDGIIDAEDAARMFPQGHGDAYGHYLTALKGYYSLLIDRDFDWVPRIEAVNILGKAVAVDYQDERKFAAAASTLAQAGRQIFDLTWRRDFQPVDKVGWEHLAATRVNDSREYDADPGAGADMQKMTRYWGADHWANRTGVGTYINWVVGNGMLPESDPDPSHEGIQKVDRTTTPELQELPLLAEELQTAMDNAEAGLSPLGIPRDGMALDIDPNFLEVGSGIQGQTHFDQIYERATAALNNAVAAFDDAKDATRLLRLEGDSLNGLQNQIVQQEMAYRNSLIEIYGTPYADDLGPGKTWKSGYDGPDLLHYMYVNLPEQEFPSLWNYPGSISETRTYKIDISDLPSDWGTKLGYVDFISIDDVGDEGVDLAGWDYANSNLDDYDDDYFIEYELGSHGYFGKPGDWTGRRASPGSLQAAISKVVAAHARLSQALYDQGATKATIDRNIALFEEEIETYKTVRGFQTALLIADQSVQTIKYANDVFQSYQDGLKSATDDLKDALGEAFPKNWILGVSSGGDLTAPARFNVKLSTAFAKKALDGVSITRNAVVGALELGSQTARQWTEFNDIENANRNLALRTAMADIGSQFEGMQNQLWGINLALREYEDAQNEYLAELAKGDRLLEEREVYRKRSAALIQGYRTRDTAFRLFRSEKLERYKTLFDLAARYTLLAANAYDYETGLLDTDEGRAFVNRIVNARALGVVSDGQPQFSGSNTGDPGLSSVLAEMKADWEVLRGRLGFNNPDSYGTTVSLRLENLRILPGADGEVAWKDYLNQSRMENILEDADVRRHCLQVGNESGLPEPGLVIAFSTSIEDGRNLFGRELAAGDHAFSPSSFATKIWSVGVALVGYQGMWGPDANEGVAGDNGDGPDLSFLDPNALSANPYVYLIPVGVDSMRSPPLGDGSAIRSWNVRDLSIPMPFNIGASDFSTRALWQSGDSLSESLFSVRKHQAFRPVSSGADFIDAQDPVQSPYTNTRLIGRSVWNSKWKLVIPGKTLLNNSDEGLERLMRTVTDIKLHLVTYSYSGN